MPTEKATQRKRGVRASRTSLARALAEAGLRTQSALAERIADLEGLDAAPKDIVSRVFRERPVEPQTIERIARALGVDAYTLYKTASEESLLATRAESVEPAGVKRAWWPAVLAGTLVLLVAGAWFFNGNAPPSSTQGTATTRPRLGLGTPTLTVLPIEGDANATLADALRTSLGEVFKVATNTAAVLTRELDPASAASRLRTDAVIDGEIAMVGRLSAIRLYLFTNGVRRQVWAESLPTIAVEDAHGDIASRASLAVRQAMGMPVPVDTVRHFPLAPVQDDYLRGELFLDRPSNELNVRRAQNYFEAALRQDANFARAHAGLCRTFLEAHWMDNEETALRNAARACGQALQLDRDDGVVATAHAQFLSRTGRNEEAMALYEQVIARNPRDAAALAALAASKLQAFRQEGDRSFLEEAKAAAQQAADMDPLLWKPLFSLATMEWFDGNIAAAITASEAAIARDENEFVLANLGSFYLCDGAFEKARAAYTRARELDPGSYVGDEFLGTAYYYLGDFERSAKLRQRAIERLGAGDPEIHEMWGNLGDSYRQAGDREKAVSAYLRAAEIAERDHLRGTAPASDRAARAWYYTMLERLKPGSVPGNVMRRIDNEIGDIAMDSASATELRRMAQTWLARGSPDKAREALERAMETCRGYAEYPDVALLITASAPDAGP